MTPASVPHHKLHFFQEKIGLTESELHQIAPFKDTFVEHSKEFADHFYRVFFSIPETRLILEHVGRHDFLLEAWAHWFRTLFAGELDHRFLSYLWRIGERHVEINLDQRFTNLGFSVARQFCHQIILSTAPSRETGTACRVVDKLLDLCVLVETSAYIEATTHCDLEVIKGIADRVRNPITVIGGHLRRLQKKVDAGDPAYGVFESLISESAGCERMVMDMKTFIDTFQEEAEFQPVALEGAVRHALERLQPERASSNATVSIELDRTSPYVIGDHRELQNMFYYLLQNSLEAVDPGNPYIRVSSAPKDTPPHSIEIEIFNTGIPPKAEDLEKLFYPFYSTKPSGSGFGLPIAKLAVRKHFGKIAIHPIPGQGTKVVVVLATPE